VLAEIVTIGDELTRGEIVDTNAAGLAARLWALGVPVRWMTSCRDDDDDIRAALTAAVGRAGLVLVSGGGWVRPRTIAPSTWSPGCSASASRTIPWPRLASRP
jgi:molybdopterin biosynthesis enzyme MoaB